MRDDLSWAPSELNPTNSALPKPASVETRPKGRIPRKRGFKMASLNIVSLVKHIDELRIFMQIEDLDLLAINESRLDQLVPDSLDDRGL